MRIATMFILGIAALVAQTSTAGENLCDGWQRSVPENKQILESDLTFEAAQVANAKIKSGEIDPVKNESEFVNLLRIIFGYGLRQQAIDIGTPESAHKFCEWLVKDGFWRE